MTRWREIIVFGCMLVFLTSCTTYREFFIEVQEPALISIPVKYDRLLIVNNAIAQTPNMGVTRTYGTEEVVSPPLEFDSIPWMVTEAFARRLGNSDFFSQVDIYTKPLREDKDFLSVLAIPQEERARFFENYDAILSIDRILLRGDISIKSHMYFADRSFLSGDLTFLNNVNIYYHDVDSAVYSFAYRDSIQARIVLKENPDANKKDDLEALFKKIAEIVAVNTADQFLPGWATFSRIVFSGSNSDMRRADTYAKENEWGKAKAIWLERDSLTSGKKAKARINHNLAVACEMQDNFKEALEWIDKAEKYYLEEKLKNNNPDLVLARAYKKELEQRLRDEQKLNIQVGTISTEHVDFEGLFEN